MKKGPAALRLWSIQPWSVWEQIQTEGRAFARPDFTDAWGEREGEAWGFRQAYDWMGAQMRQRGLPQPKGASHPMWAWAWAGEPHARPDGRRWRGAERRALLEITVAPERALISDFEIWHCALNHWFWAGSERAANALERQAKALGATPYKEAPFASCEAEALMRQSWEAMFALTPEPDGSLRLIAPGSRGWVGEKAPRRAQATLWSLERSGTRLLRELAPRPRKARPKQANEPKR